MGFPTIGVLLLGCRPPDIARFVVAIVVYAINTMLRRRCSTSIFQEPLERVEPRLTNRNPTTSIVPKVISRGIVAPLFDTLPAAILFCLCTAGGFTVPSVFGGGSLSPKAPAAFYPAASEGAYFHDGACTTVTLAFPNRPSLHCAVRVFDDQSAYRKRGPPRLSFSFPPPTMRRA
jgi:hypothetical protein